MTIEFENSPRLWALTNGGRIPPVFAAQPNFLLDSNAVTVIENKERMLSPEKEWWDSLLSSNTRVLNPLPNAFEGNTGTDHRLEMSLRHDSMKALRC